MREKTVVELVALLNDPDAPVRTAALKELGDAANGTRGFILPQPGSPPSPTALQDAAARQVMQAEVAAAGPLLAAALRDPTVEVRQAAADALGSLAANGLLRAAEVPAVAAAVADTDTGVGTRAANVLELFGLNGELGGTSAVPVLADGLAHADHEVRLCVVAALGGCGAAGVSVLAGALQDEYYRVRARAAYELGRVGAMGNVPPVDVTAAVPALVAALGDPDPRVRTPAVEALGRLGLVGVPGLVAALYNSEPDVRGLAADALGELGAAARVAVPALIELLTDEAEFYRSWRGYPHKVGGAAAAALDKIDPNAARRAPVTPS